MVTLRALWEASKYRQAHEWDMAAMAASAFVEVDFSRNPFRDRDTRSAGSFDVAALTRMHNRLKKKSK